MSIDGNHSRQSYEPAVSNRPVLEVARYMWLLGKKSAAKRKAAKTAVPSPADRALRHSRKAEASKVMDALENPELNIAAEEESGFDPYNSGVFDRSKIWQDKRTRD